MSRQSLRKLELTLAILKPHATVVPYIVEDIREQLLEHQFYIIRTRKLRIKTEDAHKFYDEHRNKFFFNRLVTFMCSGPSHVHILAKENAIQAWRDLMGPTKVYMTQHTHPCTIRGRHGLSDTRNVTHGSDSPESAKAEIEIFFPDFTVSEWYRREEEKYFNGQFEFDPEEFVHKTT